MHRPALMILLVFSCATGLGAQALPDTTVPLKSETRAFRWSLFGTVLPIGVGMLLLAGEQQETTDSDQGAAAAGLLLYTAGFYVGPSAGYFYGGLAGRGWRTVGLRLGIAAVASGIALAACPDLLDPFGPTCDNEGLATVAMVGGSLGIVASAAYDIAKVRTAVGRRNDRLRQASVTVAPVLLVHPRAVGLMTRIAF